MPSSGCPSASSRTHSASHPAGLPDLFLDRSIGRIKVPALLRAEGLRLTTLAEHYGTPQDELVTDVEWIALAAQHGWLAVMKDDRIRYVPAERVAVVQHRLRALVITNAQLPADEMARRILRSLPKAVEVCSTRDGPFLLALHANRIEELPLG